MNDDKELFINYKGQNIRLTHVKNANQFLSPSTIATNFGKGENAEMFLVLKLNHLKYHLNNVKNVLK